MRYKILVSLFLAGACVARADDEEKKKEESPLKFELGGALISARGNGNGFTAGGHGSLSYKTEGFTIGVEGSYLKVQGDEPNEKDGAALSLEHKFHHVSPFVQASYGKDLSSGILDQWTLEAGTSVTLLGGEKRWLKMSQTLAVTSEDQSGRIPAAERFWGSKTGFSGNWPMMKSFVAFGHRTTALVSFHESSDWRLSHRMSLLVSVSYLELEFSHSIDYRHLPAVGKRSLDQTTLVSIGMGWPKKEDE